MRRLHQLSSHDMVPTDTCSLSGETGASAMPEVRKGNAMQGASVQDDRPACIREGRPPRVHQAFHPCMHVA